LKSHKIEEHSY